MHVVVVCIHLKHVCIYICIFTSKITSNKRGLPQVDWHDRNAWKCGQTGITSAFGSSSLTKITPCRIVGSKNLFHWQPVEMGCEGATIISTSSDLWTTPITVTVLPSFMYLIGQTDNNLYFSCKEITWNLFREKSSTMVELVNMKCIKFIFISLAFSRAMLLVSRKILYHGWLS